MSKQQKRIFLVVVDNSSELHQALYYAARRAATADGESKPTEGEDKSAETDKSKKEDDKSSAEKK